MKQSSWTYARRFSQSFCLAAFLWLFLQTEYRGIDQLPYPVSLLFRIDPLAALADFLAPGPFGWSILWPALVVLLLTALFGRFFCGWICPLGATLDGLGKLIGLRTWGGLVGISGNPSMIDGTGVTAPTFAYYETDGTWGVEGHGVDPDIEVIDDPAKMVDGGDPQLDAAVAYMLDEIERHPYKPVPRPAYPDRSGMGIRAEDR